MDSIITEDIIRKAVNESIDEFMLEEGGAWEALKNSSLGKVGKGLWNGVKMYMDARTNGQWNRKYNQQVKGNGATVGAFYANKWFDMHYRRLQDIMYGQYYNNRTYFHMLLNRRDRSFYHDWQTNSYTLQDDINGSVYRLKLDYYDNIAQATIEDYNGDISNAKSITYSKEDNSYDITFENGVRVKVNKGEDTSTPESYIAKNCTPNSFVQYTQNTLQDGDMKLAILKYIEAIQAVNKKNIDALKANPNARINRNEILKLFTLQSFSSWYSKNASKTKGAQNNNNSQNQQTSQQKQQTA